MHDWLNYSMSVNQIVRKSLPWQELYESQAAALHQRLRSQEYIDGPIVLIGHSNGGMISRYLGRHPAAYNELGTSYSYAPLNVQGVITVGTPHQGAPLAQSAGTLNNLIGWGGWPAKIVCPIFGLAGCYRFGELAGSGINHYMGKLASPVPVLNEMQPRDSYHADFNAQPEYFQRFGVQSYIWKRWGCGACLVICAVCQMMRDAEAAAKRAKRTKYTIGISPARSAASSRRVGLARRDAR